jgi:hypothetical protein
MLHTLLSSRNLNPCYISSSPSSCSSSTHPSTALQSTPVQVRQTKDIKHASTRIRPPPSPRPVLSTVHVQTVAHRPARQLPWTSLVAKLVCRFLESGNGMSDHDSIVSRCTDYPLHVRAISSEALVLIDFDAGTWPDTSWTGCGGTVGPRPRTILLLVFYCQLTGQGSVFCLVMVQYGSVR